VFEIAIIQVPKEDLRKMRADYEKHKKNTPSGVEIRPFEEVLGSFTSMGFDIAQEAMVKREEYLRGLREKRPEIKKE
jgi:hypothetical protein